MMLPFTPQQETELRTWVENHVWPEGPVCSGCRLGSRITKRKDGYYRCNACKIDFTCKSGSLVEGSHIPLYQWFNMMSAVALTPEGVSVRTLAGQLGLTEKSTRYMLHRLFRASPRDKRSSSSLTAWDLAAALFSFKPAK